MTTTTKKKKILTPEEKAAHYAAAEEMTNKLVDQAAVALQKFETYTQEQVDKIVAAMALAGSENALLLAMMKRDVVLLKIRILKTVLHQNLFIMQLKMIKQLVLFQKIR